MDISGQERDDPSTVFLARWRWSVDLSLVNRVELDCLARSGDENIHPNERVSGINQALSSGLET